MSNDLLNSFLQQILLEVAVDDRVESGIMDLSNDVHLDVLAEKLCDYDLDPHYIQEVVNTLALRDGKYPDRQAYNKEGWLVTFPTPEHRTAAIKKKTHFASDPTHGNGGMNLYYKRKGKQSRQKSQGSSETDVEPTEPTTNQPPADQSTAPSQQSTTSDASNGETTSALPPSQSGGDAPTTSGPAGDTQSTSNAGGEPVASVLPTSDAATDGAKDGTETKSSDDSRSSSSTSEPKPVEKSLSAKLAELSIEFAKSKDWTSTPYGDWNDSRGQLSGVTSVDGQVVPVKFADRETFRSLVVKHGINIPSDQSTV